MRFFKYVGTLFSIGLLFFLFQNCGSKNKSHDAVVVTQSVCELDEHLEVDVCVPNEKTCTITNGTGKQVWEDDAYGACTVVSCNTNYKPVSNACVFQSKACTVVNGTGMTQANGTCKITACNAAHHLESNACKPDLKACTVPMGTAQQLWNATTKVYGACTVKACIAGFSNRGNKCTSAPVLQLEPLPPSETGKAIYVSPAGDDENNGLTVDKPVKSPQRAVGLSRAGDVVLFMQGVYENKLKSNLHVLTVGRNGTETAWITFRAFPGHMVKFKAHERSAISLFGASYIIVDGFELEGNNLTVTKAYADANYDKGDNALLYNRGLYAGYNQISKAPSHHLWIQNLTVHNFSGGGIMVNWSDDVTVQDNDVYRNGYWNGENESGISIFEPSNFGAHTTAYRTTIRRNKSFENECKVPLAGSNPKQITGGYGIAIEDTMHMQKASFPAFPSAAYDRKILVANNVVYRNGAAGLYTHQSENVDFLFNTSYGNIATAAMPATESEAFASQSKLIKFLYNIIVPNTVRAPNTSAAQAKSTSITFNYNLYFGGKVPAIKGANDIVADPKFVDVTKSNFKVTTSSPAINKSPDTTIKHDIDGVARPKGVKSDLGAYEIK